MIVVSDTTPMNYLAIIGHLDILPSLFGTVVIPPSVASELLHVRAPEAVRRFMASPPSWLQVQLPDRLLIELAPLGAGEREAISLSLELHAHLLLTDDQQARKAAESHGLVVTGTLGLLRLAGRRRLIDVPRALTKLQGSTLRLPAAGVKELLDEFSTL